MIDLWKDFWIRETETGQQVALFNDRYMMMMMMIIIILNFVSLRSYNISVYRHSRCNATNCCEQSGTILGVDCIYIPVRISFLTVSWYWPCPQCMSRFTNILYTRYTAYLLSIAVLNGVLFIAIKWKRERKFIARPPYCYILLQHSTKYYLIRIRKVFQDLLP